MNNIRIINKNPDYVFDHECSSYCTSNVEDFLDINKKVKLPQKDNKTTLYCLNESRTNLQTCSSVNKPNYIYSNTFIAVDSYFFLKQVYNILTFIDADTFLTNETDDLPIYTKKRLCDALYLTFINDIQFPNKKFIKLIKQILNEIYNIDITTKKIIKIIMKTKNKKLPYSIYDLFVK